MTDNALYVLALKLAADLADFHEQPGDAERWRARAAAVGPALVRENWDSSVGAFFDGGPCPGGDSSSKCPVHAQDGNSIAILAGVADWDAAFSITGYLSGALARPWGNAFYDSSVLSPGDQFDQRVYPFISYFEIAARFQYDPDTAFEELMRLYGWMATHDPFSTFWEGIGPGGAPYEDGFTSMAHGWSTGVVPLLTNYALGLRPLAPGFRHWLFAPASKWEGMDWARGAVKSLWGPLWVQWQRSSTSLKMIVDAPAGTDGSVVVPLADGETELSLDGQVVWTKDGGASAEGVTPGDGKVVLSVKGGTRHVFETT